MQRHLNSSQCLTKTGKIKQSALKEFAMLEATINSKKKQLSALKKEIERLEWDRDSFDAILRNLMSEGHKVSVGELIIHIGIKETKPRLSWKDLFMKWVPDGVKKAQELLDTRPVETTKYVIVEPKTGGL